ncbi:MAG: restriction endonuclease subunit S [Aggregatilineales bacterium]
MASEWLQIALNDAPIEIIDGDRGNGYPSQGEFSFAGYCLFLNAGNVTNEGFDFTNVQFITREKDAQLRKGKLDKYDTVLTTRGTVGNVAYFGQDVPYTNIRINSGMVLLRADKTKIDPKYIYMVMRSEIIKSQIRGLTSGSAQPQLPIRDIKRLEIMIPPLPEQRAIAHILGSLDDKIELNRRMNATLEETARALFKSWFVDFDPVRAKMEGRQPEGIDAETAALFPDRLVESELGPIPEGWRVGCLGDVAMNPRRGVQPQSLSADTLYIGLEHMPQHSISLSDWGRATDVESNKYQFFQGEFLFGKLRPYFHKVGVAPIGGICSTDILVVTPSVADWGGYVLMVISDASFIEYTTQVSGGTRMPRVNWSDMAGYGIAIPDVAVTRVFSEFVNQTVDLLIENIHQSRTLVETRDALLPKLMSGELRIINIQESSR